MDQWGGGYQIYTYIYIYECMYMCLVCVWSVSGLCLSLCLCLSVCLCVCLSACMYGVYVRICLYLFICTSISTQGRVYLAVLKAELPALPSLPWRLESSGGSHMSYSQYLSSPKGQDPTKIL